MDKKKFKILCFDPGISTTGFSLLEGNTSDGDLVVLKIGEIHPGPTVDRAVYREQVEKFDKRTISLAYLQEQISVLMDTSRPDFVCSEDIYCNPRLITAYGSLCMWVCAVRMHLRRWYDKYLVTIPTKVCKKAVASRGDGGKASVQEALKNHPHIHFKVPEDYFHASEHVLDSIAVGAAFAEKYRDLIIKTLENQNG